MTVFYLPRTQVKASRASSIQKSEREREGLRVGFTVGRGLGGAVQRNRMKRRLREAVRISLADTSVEADVVINPKKSVLATEFEELLKEVRRAFAVIEQKFSDRKPADTRKQGPVRPRPEASTP
jgi:ribonuclease P protein component